MRILFATLCCLASAQSALAAAVQPPRPWIWPTTARPLLKVQAERESRGAKLTFKIRPPRRHLFKKLKALVKIGGNVIDTFPIKSARWSSFERKIDLPKDLEGAALPTEVTLVDKKGQRVGQDTGWVWLPGGFWRNLSNWWHRNWFWIPPAPF